MSSAWKLRRELGRIGQQLRGLGDRLMDPAKQRRLDRTVSAGLPLLQGTVPLLDKVALVLLYQPSGIAQSILHTCNWLAASGYSPFVVSNAPIRNEDRTRLADTVWRAVERPNFGYDFGGYRDGLSCLAQWGVSPDELLILNDSVWLPMQIPTDLLERLSAHPADIAGTILRKRGTEQFLESYLYRLRKKVLTHPHFAAFWKDLRLTSNKYHVIRRGERGFSAAMQAAGMQLAGVYSSVDLLGLMAQQDDDFLRLTLRYAAYIDTASAAERDRLLAESDSDWRARTLAHVSRVLTKRLGYSSFPFAMVQLTGYPLLKKSAEPISRTWRLAQLAAIENGDLPQPPEPMLAEIRARDAKP